MSEQFDPLNSHVIDAQNFLSELTSLFSKYDIEFDTDDLFLKIRPLKYGFGYVELYHIGENGEWVFVKEIPK